MIRKISVGPSVINDSMHFSVGQMVGRDKQHKITQIVKEENESFNIYVINLQKQEEFIWKYVSPSSHVVAEYLMH